MAEVVLKVPKKKRKSQKPTIVLDMDETMIHSAHEHSADVFKQISIPVTPETKDLRVDFSSDSIQIYVMARPGLFEFLFRIGQLYEIIAWTLAPQAYAEVALDLIQDTMKRDYGVKKVFKNRLYRQDCDEGVKDLRKLQIDLGKVLIVDDVAESFQLQKENGLQIPKYIGGTDVQLLHLC